MKKLRAQRVEVGEDVKQIFSKMTDGSPEAASILTRLMLEDPLVDPDGFMPGVGVVHALDAHGIYGERICTLYQTCDGDAVKVLAVLRAIQLGGLLEEDLNLALDGLTRLDHTSILVRVQRLLPRFAG